MFRSENLLDENGTVAFRIPKAVSDKLTSGEYHWGVGLKYNADNPDAADCRITLLTGTPSLISLA